jgi:septum formation topological specificity factor MinE
MSNLRVETIKEKCEEHNIKFRKGKFKNGAKYRLSIVVEEERIVWPCKTLKQCTEAIVQALHMKEFIPVE